MLMDAVQLVVGIRWSARAAQHAGPAAPPGVRGVVATWLAVVDRLIGLLFQKCVSVNPFPTLPYLGTVGLGAPPASAPEAPGCRS